MRDGRVRRDLRRSLPGPPCGGRDAQTASGRAADVGGARSARPLAAPLHLAEGIRDRRLRARDIRTRLHPRRPHLRPLAQGLTAPSESSAFARLLGTPLIAENALGKAPRSFGSCLAILKTV